MKDNLSRYTLRVEQVLLDKLGYIAEYEGRTKNRELEQMIKKRISDFEKEHGEIPQAKRRRSRLFFMSTNLRPPRTGSPARRKTPEYR